MVYSKHSLLTESQYLVSHEMTLGEDIIILMINLLCVLLMFEIETYIDSHIWTLCPISHKNNASICLSNSPSKCVPADAIVKSIFQTLRIDIVVISADLPSVKQIIMAINVKTTAATTIKNNSDWNSSPWIGGKKEYLLAFAISLLLI